MPPIYYPPVFDPGALPEHPEVPDLNAGSWMIVVKPDEDKSKPDVTAWAFVPWPLAVTHPDYQPKYPPDSMQPGEWVVIVYGGSPVNAWIPSTGSSEKPPSGGTTPEEPTATPQ
jgi:hypothetical protein